MLEIEMGKGKPPGAPKSPFDHAAGPADEGEGEESGDEFESAASEAFDALQEGDVEGFKHALKLAIHACGEEY